MPFLQIVLLAIHLMVLTACLGCNRPFDTSKGLEIHQRSCKPFASTIRNVLLKRTQQHERPGPTKFARVDLPTATDALNGLREPATIEENHQSGALPANAVPNSILVSFRQLYCFRFTMPSFRIS